MRLATGLLLIGMLWTGGELSTSHGAGQQFQPAEVISAVDAAYPITSLAIGTVVLNAHVSASGKVEELTVVKGIPSLTEAAKKAVMQWKFRPARLDGVPIETEVPVGVTFVRQDLSPRFGSQGSTSH